MRAGLPSQRVALPREGIERVVDMLDRSDTAEIAQRGGERRRMESLIKAATEQYGEEDRLVENECSTFSH